MFISLSLAQNKPEFTSQNQLPRSSLIHNSSATKAFAARSATTNLDNIIAITLSNSFHTTSENFFCIQIIIL